MNFEHIKKLLEITSYGQITKLYNLLAEKHNEPKIYNFFDEKLQTETWEADILERMRCPKCHSPGSFIIQANNAALRVSDDMIELVGRCPGYDHSGWDKNSECVCEKCRFSDIVKNFRIN